MSLLQSLVLLISVLAATCLLYIFTRIINPLCPHDASKHHFASL